jgi:hypothetical protein
MSKPINTIRIGGIECAIWENEGRFSATFKRRYKDKNGEYKDTTFFSAEDCALVSAVASKAAIVMSEAWQSNKQPSTKVVQSVTQDTSDDDAPF